MSSLRWALLGLLTLSLGVACGSSEGHKVTRPDQAAGNGGSAGDSEAGAGNSSGGATAGGRGHGGGGTPAAGHGGLGEGGVGAAGEAGLSGAGEGGAAQTDCVPLSELGGHIYYSTVPSVDAPNGEVRIATGAGNTKLTDGQNPKLAPDGKHLAFQRDRHVATDISTANLWMRDMLAGTEKLIFDNTDHQVGYAFTLTSDKLLYDYSCGQYSMSLDGTGGSTLFEVGCYDDDPSPQPVSNGLFAYHNQSGIQLRDAAYANPHTLTNSVAGDYWPAWSPDGQTLTFCAYTDSTLTCAFQVMGADGSARTHLGDTVNANNAAFSADASKVVTSGLKDGAKGLHVFAADGSGYLGIVCGSADQQVEYVGTITQE